MVKTKVVKIGNSRGIRIPKVVLDQVGFGSVVEIEVKKDTLVIRATRRAREGWEERFKELGPDDCPLDNYVPNEFDESEWVW